MPFLASVSPDITESIPAQLSLRSASVASTRVDTKWDVSLGGVGFCLWIDAETPYRRETVPVRKQQVDQGAEIGEQSLDGGWWLRSQRSFHFGAGQLFRDPETVGTEPLRFLDSLGVDVWRPGKVTLLPKATKVFTTAGATLLTSGNTQNSYFHSDGTVLKFVNDAGSSSTINYDGAGGANTINSMTTRAGDAIVSTSSGVWQAGTATKLYNDLTGARLITYVKARLMGASNRALYELVAAGPGLPAALYTHPDTSWVWNSFAEAGGAILVAGNSVNGNAEIHRLIVDSSGALPTLTGGAVAATLPPGERINHIAVYLGNILAISTTAGLRVCQVTDAGEIALGGLTIEGECSFAAGKGDYLYVGAKFSDIKIGGAVETEAVFNQYGLLRVAPARPLSDGLYAWNFDLQSHSATGAVSSILPQTATVFSGTSVGVYKENAADPEDSGFLKTSSVRYGMTEPKLFKRLSVDSMLTGSDSIAAAIIFPGGSETTIITIGALNAGDEFSTGVFSPLRSASLRFTLTGDEPEFNGYQLKALPAAKRSRLIQVPLNCLDYGNDSRNTRWGYTGRGWEAVEMLETTESLGDTFIFQDFRTGEGAEVQIEQQQFFGKTQPDKGAGNFGGVLLLTLRTVE